MGEANDGEGAVNYSAVFQAMPGLAALLTPELVYVDANVEFLRASGRTREQVIGRYLFDVFPDNPTDPDASGARHLQASLQRVLDTGETDTMGLQRYDVESMERPGEWDERYWSPVNAPILGPNGKVILLVHRVEDITELVKAHNLSDTNHMQTMKAELYTRARELQAVNEQLRQAHAREREIALSLQQALLPAPADVDHRAAVRYRPAVDTLNICGDWYDLIELPGDRISVAVGDVVGHGLHAAGVMGLLRSALSAAARVADGPAQALEVLALYAGSVNGAENTTAVKVHIERNTHTITYSSAGHPPPALLHTSGSIEFLDRATAPPLGTPAEHTSRPQASTTFTEGDTLVLYTDGLIERRGEDIDVGLARLSRTLIRNEGAHPENLADAILRDLLPADGGTDDTALVVLRL